MKIFIYSMLVFLVITLGIATMISTPNDVTLVGDHKSVVLIKGEALVINWDASEEAIEAAVAQLKYQRQ